VQPVPSCSATKSQPSPGPKIETQHDASPAAKGATTPSYRDVLGGLSTQSAGSSGSDVATNSGKTTQKYAAAGTLTSTSTPLPSSLTNAHDNREGSRSGQASAEMMYAKNLSNDFDGEFHPTS